MEKRIMYMKRLFAPQTDLCPQYLRMQEVSEMKYCYVNQLTTSIAVIVAVSIPKISTSLRMFRFLFTSHPRLLPVPQKLQITLALGHHNFQQEIQN